MENLLQLFATQTTFENVITLAAQHENIIGPLSGNFDFTLSTPRCDKIAEALVPKGFNGYYPLRSTGDGNCLFNSISQLLCGSEKLAIELRLRTVLELVSNFNYYADHPLVKNAKITAMSKRASLFTTQSIYDTIIFGKEAHNVYGTTGDFYATVEKGIMLTAVNYQYSGLLQIVGLASVIQRDIKTVYPDQRSRFLPILQTTVQPRLTSFKCQSSLDVFIMWSNIQGWPDRSKTFCVNHFVPLIRRKSLPSHMKFDTESVRSKDGWNIYACKRKRRGSNLICHSHNDSPDCILLSDSKRRATSQPTTDNRWHVLVEDKETDLRDEYEGEYENIKWKSAEKMELKPCCEKIGALNKENVGNKQNIHKEESLERIPSASARNTDFENIDNPGLKVKNDLIKDVNETSDTSEQEIQCIKFSDFALNELKKRKSLPFPAASETFYKKQNADETTNESRAYVHEN